MAIAKALNTLREIVKAFIAISCNNFYKILFLIINSTLILSTLKAIFH